MSISIENYTDCMTNAKIQMLTCSFDTLIYLLGNWIVYNDLVIYNNVEPIDLAIGTKVYSDNKLVITIWINNKFIKDIQVKNIGNELIYKLDQLDDIIEINTKGNIE